MSSDESKAVGRISPFERIRHADENGEYWSARELSRLLGYSGWQRFAEVIERARNVCGLVRRDEAWHFQSDSRVVATGKGAERDIVEFRLTRYAVYLILLCSDVNKPEVVHALAFLALAQLDDAVGGHATLVPRDIPDLQSIAVTKEQKTIGQIVRAFRHLRNIRQYHVPPYYIDLYFPDEKIAVECDEFGHQGYSREAENQRERYIKKALHCTFVRYNPDDPSFSIGDVIYAIMRLVYSHERALASKGT